MALCLLLLCLIDSLQKKSKSSLADSKGLNSSYDQCLLATSSLAVPARQNPPPAWFQCFRHLKRTQTFYHVIVSTGGVNRRVTANIRVSLSTIHTGRIASCSSAWLLQNSTRLCELLEKPLAPWELSGRKRVAGKGWSHTAVQSLPLHIHLQHVDHRPNAIMRLPSALLHLPWREGSACCCPGLCLLRCFVANGKKPH